MKKNRFVNILPYILVLAVMFSLFTYSSGSNTKSFTYNQFKEEAPGLTFDTVNVAVGRVVLNVEGIYLDNQEKVRFSVTVPNTPEMIDWILNVTNEGTNSVVVYDPDASNFFLDLLINLLPLIFFGGLAFILFSKMGSGGQNKAFEFSKSRAKVESDIKVRFDDVAGCDEEKEEVKEIIDYLKNPQRFSDMGARIPKGVLMVGPPGTGKTLLAKAVAGEANVPFFSISGSDFVEMFVGTGASRVRDMFKKAMQVAPCIVFIDEIDAVGRQRGAGLGGGNDEREQTLNQLLVEMDGMGDNRGIVIIAATNRPDVLDPALLRSGRFDRQVTVNLPDKKGRTEILGVHARNKKLAPDVNLENLAKRTPGFSGADLENVLNEGAILAVRDHRTVITMADLDEAIDRVIAGPAKKSKTYTPQEKKLVAYHETGHTIIGLKLESANMVQKVTIIPRGTAGGYNLMTPREEKMFATKEDLMAKITGYLGGRVAEEVVFGEISTGASNDIQEATKIAKGMVRSYGMSDLGPIQYDEAQGSVFLGRDYGSNANNYSGQIAFEIDKEVRNIINECYENAKRIIEENRELMDLIATTLMEEETLTNEQIMNLVHYGTIVNPNAPVVNKEDYKEKELEVIDETVAQTTTAEEKEAEEPMAESVEGHETAEEEKAPELPKEEE